jgi:peptidoglycan/LPS O-acetylase OafA/YrhL
MARRFGGLKLPSWNVGVPYFLLPPPDASPRWFTYFFAGSAFYLWRDRIPKSPAIFVGALAVSILSLRYGAADLTLIMAGTYCVLFVAMSFVATPRIFGERVDLSYGVYLFGFPIQQLLICYTLQSMMAPLLLFVTSFGITCIVAYLSWRFIESPCLRWKWPTISERVTGKPAVLAAAQGWAQRLVRFRGSQPVRLKP